MPSVTARDGVPLQYEVRGDGPLTLLFMHGWSGTGSYFDRTLEYLNLAGLRAVCLDLRGHGASGKPDHGYTDEQIAVDALAVADAVQADLVVPVGFSMSGRFAQYVALLAPGRIRGLVLVAGCPASPIPLPEATRRDWVARVGNPQALAAVTAMFITRPVDSTVLDRLGRGAAMACETALDATLGLCMKETFVDRLHEIRAPTIVVGGIHDSIFPPEFLRDTVAGRLARARTAFLDSNHEVPIEQPREMAAILEAFVAGLG
jgi:pimeloyl-ACP methyl ester carboxylesterase